MESEIAGGKAAIEQSCGKADGTVLRVGNIYSRNKRAISHIHQVERRFNSRVVQFVELMLLERREGEPIGISIQPGHEQA
jgi:hypothetical protein